jgi:hypothetical protein
MARKRKRTTKTVTTDLNSREAVEHFRKVAEEFTRRGARSKESAMKVLVESGIYNESGELSKNYRS